MSLYGTYDPGNIFAKIIRGELESFKVYEDDDVLAFLDAFPQSRGHTLVIPKNSIARNILEIDDQTLCTVMRKAKMIAGVLVRTLAPDGVQILQFNGGPGGQSVYHIHVHIVPRWPDQPLGLHAQVKGNPAELAMTAEQIRVTLALPEFAASA